MKRVPKLIILRGPSGSGKTTTARKLFKAAKKPTVLIGQDYYRMIFSPPGHAINNKTIQAMIKHNILIALEDGYDVIVEGIFNAKTFKTTFAEIISENKTQNYFFYFDMSFEETLNRHKNKNTNKWGEKEMREWYKAKDSLGYDFEYTISESMSQEQIVKFIKQKTDI